MTHLRDQHAISLPADRRPTGILPFLVVEYFDELVFTIIGVAMPFVRDSLALDYAEVGLLFGLPAILSAVLEPILLLLGDSPLRPRLILLGGVLLGLAFLLVAGADSFAVLLLALTLAYPASGAFVSLSQATMIERHPARESEMMARWTAAGTVGSLTGPVLFGAAVAVGLHWRSTFVVLGAVCIGLAFLVRSPRPAHPAPLGGRTLVAGLLGNLRLTVRLPRLWRWLLLLPLADLMLDVFFGYIALFLTDVVGMPPATAAAATTVWLIGFLIGQFVLARRIARMSVRRVIRWTAAVTLIVFPIWLLAPLGGAARLVGLLVLGLLASPWYPLLQAEAFAAAPGRAATVTALTSVTGTAGGILAALAGAAAAIVGLSGGLALLLVGPAALLLLTPPTASGRESERAEAAG